MRALIDQWWPLIETGQIESIVMTASGCGAFIREYVHHLSEDIEYKEKAQRVSELTKDLCEVLEPQPGVRTGRVALHSPCTLQHGQKIHGKVEALLSVAGYEIVSTHESHLCCGSAGTYSILQKQLSLALRERKISALCAEKPTAIATANIGCLMHLQAGTNIPVRHWIELLDHAQT